MTLVEFLLARIAEDEVVALTAQDLEVGNVPRPHPWAVFGPERILTECEAKRRIISWVHQWPFRPEPPSSVDGLLPILALPYADHPDYRQEWKP